MKRLSVILSLVCFIASAPAFAKGQETLVSGDYKYVLTEEGTAEITGYTGEAEELEVPDELDGHDVTGIEDYAFFACTSLTDVVLPESIRSMGANPFRGCKEVSFKVSPDHVYLAVIDGALFSKPDKRLICCLNTKDSYVVPDGIQCVGDYAFSMRDRITGITLPDSLESIGDGAFTFCSSLTEIALPNGLTSIGDWVFSDCKNLTSIIIPERLTDIGKCSF